MRIRRLFSFSVLAIGVGARALGGDAPVEEETAQDSAIAVALELQKSFEGVARKVFPSVVTVTTYVRDPQAAEAVDSSGRESSWVVEATRSGFPGFRRLAAGSGVVVSDDGYVLTARHILLQDDGQVAPVIDVQTQDGRHTLSRFVGAEPTLNLAVIRLEVYPEGRPPRFEPARFGDSTAVRVGHWAIAVGDPSGPEKFFTPGLFTTLPARECYQEQLSAAYLQAAMTVHPEAYGGALVDIHGNLVGILTPRNPQLGAIPAPDGYGLEFALPSRIVVGLYESIRSKQSARSPWLGYAVMSMAELRKELGHEAFKRLQRPRSGIYIENVFEPSPAARAGMRVGDFLVRFDGHRLRSPIEFQKWLYLAGIGATVSVEIYRNGEEITWEMTIEERPANAITR
jgi:S1-C subfamily serine protease